jgi:hypothetical protein
VPLLFGSWFLHRNAVPSSLVLHRQLLAPLVSFGFWLRLVPAIVYSPVCSHSQMLPLFSPGIKITAHRQILLMIYTFGHFHEWCLVMSSSVRSIVICWSFCSIWIVGDWAAEFVQLNWIRAMGYHVISSFINN